ncbi:MAG: type II toxin-antitoxin system RelE/ParE family toxin [Verrucomicrobia bacterium]|nr:type II toxin-antitoxin system RelE/ParE family toxin [Verrucomicrobiota bacterium]
MELDVHKLELANGRVPFDDWFQSLGNPKTQAAVDARVARLRAGNLGDVKSVGGGVFELPIDFGPGLRIYFGRRGPRVAILLGAGDKSTQARDIRRAQQLWKDFNDATQKLP